MLRAYEWKGIAKGVIELTYQLMSKKNTRLEIWNEGKKFTYKWTEMLCGFLQGNGYPPTGFCISEIPVCKLLQQSKGCKMGVPGNGNVKRTHSLFANDLKQ